MSSEQATRGSTLPVDVRRALVASDGTVNDQMLTIAEETAGQFGMPLAGITIMGGKPYVNNTGLTWLTQHDGRGVKEITARKVRDAWDDDKDRRAEYHATVTFKDGSSFTAYGFASLLSVRMGSMKNPDFINMLGETRAKNRAMRTATGCSLTSAEEMDRAEIMTPLPASGRTVIVQESTEDTDDDTEVLEWRASVESYRAADGKVIAAKEKQLGRPVAQWTIAECQKADPVLAERAKKRAVEQENDAVEPTSQQEYAEALELARLAVQAVQAKPGGPTLPDQDELRHLLVQLQRLQPRDGETPAAKVNNRDLLSVIASHLPVGAEQGEQPVMGVLTNAGALA